MVIKRVRPLSCARIAAVVYAALGLVIGAILALVSLSGGFATAAFAAAPSFRPPSAGFTGVGLILAVPVEYGAMGAVMALVGAWLYNVAARVLGGIEIDIG